MKKILLPVLLFITCISYSQIRISGTVIDAIKKVPLSKAIVTLDGSDNTLITDSEGYFTVVLKESGIYEFSVSKNGYKSLAQELILNESIEIQIALTSNSGTEEPVYTTSSTKKNEAKYLQKDEYSKSKKAKEEKLKAEKKAEEDRKIQALELAEKKRKETEKIQQELMARKKALEDKKANEALLASRERLAAEQKIKAEKDALKRKKDAEIKLRLEKERNAKVQKQAELDKIKAEKLAKESLARKKSLEDKKANEQLLANRKKLVETEKRNADLEAQNKQKNEAAKLKIEQERNVNIQKQAKIDELAAQKSAQKSLALKNAQAAKLAKEKELFALQNNLKNQETEIVKETTSKASFYTLSGSIRDKYTKETINNAVISFSGIKKTYSTTYDGLFKIEIPEGAYLMQVKAKGFNLETADIPVSMNLDFTILLSRDSLISITTEAVVISGTRATKYTPTTFSKISKEELAENNLGKDLPYLLELTPSVVASSDGGNGVGYTSMRIRGSDMTRINFTLNGFPVNDAESQGVFLVNTPDLASDAKDIQIQRGIGTSSNGAGAFGASVNINTNENRTKPYAEFYNSFGSFMTMKNTIKAGTGELFKHFTFDGRFSHLMTDGFIDRAEAKMFAYTLNAAYYNIKTIIRFNLFAGNERTYQAWNGVDKNQAENDRTFNSAGTDYGQKAIPYDNEIDNYDQKNYQLSFSHQFSNRISANLGFHYTKGSGYFEQYKVGEDLLDYGKIGGSNNTDLIRRRWLDNDFFGSIFSVAYKAKNIHATLGGGWNQYDGDHFGEIIWATDAKNIAINEKYYDNNGLKTDFNTFLKAEYTIKRFVLFGDVQYRRVSYSVEGIDNDQRRLQEDVDYNFVNPKVGLTYLLGEKKNAQVYTSFAMANKEPSRNDFIDNEETPEPENMIDFELGYRTKSKKLNFGMNAFYMKYKNQLVLTGELNDVGSAVRANVDNSFRTGIEAELAYEPIKYFGLNTTATWSLNEIDEFTLVDYTGTTVTHDKTKISYSPAFTGSLTLYTKAFKGFKFGIINKFVSEQFLDNTTTKENTLSAYYLMDARASYSIKPKFMSEIEFILKVNNITNTKYSTNGYVYYDSPYFYPQAGTNFEGGVNLKF